MTDNKILDRSKNDLDNPPESPKAKGARLKRVRLLANLSREQFCEASDINLASLISWEVGRFSGLSEKGAKKVIARVAQEGVFCTLEWLLYEIGSGPEVKVDYKKGKEILEESKIETAQTDESTLIIEELLLFRKLHNQSIDFIVKDDAMLPHYELGDYIAGIKRSNEEIKKLIGKNCIVQLKDGGLLFRNLQQGPRGNSFILLPLNLQSHTVNSISYDVELNFAASVTWHRKSNTQ